MRVVTQHPSTDRRQDYLADAPVPGAPPFPDMVWVPGGQFLMGSELFYPEERPVRTAVTGGFWMDRAPVTNALFRRFVEETGHVTSAERGADPAGNPAIDASLFVPGGLVFQPSDGPIPLDDARRWWAFTPGATWRLPHGRRLAGTGAPSHPVVQVSHLDALAYAAWAGKALPTETEWEFAARGGLDGAIFAWGDRETTAKGRHLANTWQGRFPYRNSRADGYHHTSPVGSYPANGYGLQDMTGNVWEWTADRADGDQPRGCCGHTQGAASRFVLKGGSYLCSPEYCLRYRPSARTFQDEDMSSCHIGFRCILRP